MPTGSLLHALTVSKTSVRTYAKHCKKSKHGCSRQYDNKYLQPGNSRPARRLLRTLPRCPSAATLRTNLLCQTDLQYCFRDLFKYVKAKRTKKSIEGWKIKHELVLRNNVLFRIANLRNRITRRSVKLKQVTAQQEWRQEVIDWKTARAARGMEAQVSRWGWRG